LIIATLLSACAYTPVAFDQNQMFIGSFKSKQEKDDFCLYNEIEGIGIKLGWTVVGFGYFNRKVLTVHTQKDGQCGNEFVTVYLDDCEEKHCKIIEKSMEGN
jgi:hypothetical protein